MTSKDSEIKEHTKCVFTHETSCMIIIILFKKYTPKMIENTKSRTKSDWITSINVQSNVCRIIQTHINNYSHENSLKHQRYHYKYRKKYIEHLNIKIVLNDTPVLKAP